MTEPWENNSTVSRDWDAEAGYEQRIAGMTTGAMLLAVVVIGVVGTVLIGGVYSVRAYRSRNTSRYGRRDKKLEDTDPLLEASPP